jgi:ParB-like nuclease domain
MNAICNNEVEWQVQRISLAAITVDAAVQQRAAGTSQHVVADYAEAMCDGVAFPPIDVFRDEDGAFYLANGFHRLDAQQSAYPDVEEIECRVHPGNRDDALLFACGANAQHGLRRSRRDKMKAVTTLLSSERWSGWSDREIARQCGVSHGFVAAIRRDHLDSIPVAGQAEEASAADAGLAPDRQRRVRRGGGHYDMNTARIGRTNRRKKVAPKPKLNPLAWSEANAQERTRFIEAAGRGSVEHALHASEPLDEVTWLNRTFRRFERVLRSASEPARQTFLAQSRDEILALTQAAEPPIAAAPTSAELASSTAPLARPNASGGGVGDE